MPVSTRATMPRRRHHPVVRGHGTVGSYTALSTTTATATISTSISTATIFNFGVKFWSAAVGYDDLSFTSGGKDEFWVAAVVHGIFQIAAVGYDDLSFTSGGKGKFCDAALAHGIF